MLPAIMFLAFSFSCISACTLQPGNSTYYSPIKRDNKFVVKGVVVSIRKIYNEPVTGNTAGSVGGLAGSMSQSRKKALKISRKLSKKYNGLDERGRLVSIKNEYAIEILQINNGLASKAYEIYEVKINLDNGRWTTVLMKNIQNIRPAARVIIERAGSKY